MNIQTQPSTEAVVVATGTLGISVFAAQRLAPRERILTFCGPVISFLEAVRKGSLESYALQIAKGAYLDTCAPGCYVNHSCEPNAGIVNGIYLVAIRPIEDGEEIRFDYSTTMDEDHWTMICRCGTESCRKIITDFKYLPAQLRERYLRQGIVQPFISEPSLRTEAFDGLLDIPSLRTHRQHPTAFPTASVVPG